MISQRYFVQTAKLYRLIGGPTSKGLVLQIPKGGAVTNELDPLPLPDLVPDVQFARLHVSNDADVAFAYEVKRAAIGPHVAKRWGWDHDFQWSLHLQRFTDRCFFRISFNERAVGTVALTEVSGYVRLDEFYLIPEMQRRGFGTRILRHILAHTDKAGLPVRLQHLQWNPAGSLYRRHGFIRVGETDSHFLLMRSPCATGDGEGE